MNMLLTNRLLITIFVLISMRPIFFHPYPVQKFHMAWPVLSSEEGIAQAKHKNLQKASLKKLKSIFF